MKRCGIVKVSKELLAQLLELPDGHTIITLWEDNTVYDNCFFIRIDGPSMPEVHESEIIPEVDLKLTLH